MITYESLQVNLPVNLLQLEEVVWSEQINSHAKGYLNGVLPEEEGNRAMESLSFGSDCIIKGNGEILFQGIISGCEVDFRDGLYILHLDFSSSSVLLDTKQKRKSFQNIHDTYCDTIKEIAEKQKSMVLVNQVQDANPQAPVIQYEETDWKFMKRLASYMNTFLYPDVTCEKNVLNIGPRSASGTTINGTGYQIGKSVEDFRTFQENVGGITENSCTFYRVDSFESLRLGETVNFQGCPYTIYTKNARLEDGTLRFQYGLMNEDGLKILPKYNESFRGAGIMGTILEVVDGYKLKLHLEIDEKQSKSDAFPYDFSSVYVAEGSTGWYFIPEVGEQVCLFCKERDEQTAYITRVRQKETTYTRNPDIRYTGTPEDTELTVKKHEMVFNIEDGKLYVWVSEQNGLVIESDEEIMIHSDGDIDISCDSFWAKAKNAVNLVKDGKSIIVDSIVQFNG